MPAQPGTPFHDRVETSAAGENGQGQDEPPRHDVVPAKVEISGSAWRIAAKQTEIPAFAE